MKSKYIVALVLLISISYSTQKHQPLETIFNLNATFKGSTDDYLFKFIDNQNIEHLFYDVDEPNVDDESEEAVNANKIDLTNDKYIGKKFAITWSYKNVAQLNDDGEETGKFDKVKSILTIKEIK